MNDDFDRRVRSLYEAPFTLASIRIRARALRRRWRRAIAGALALVALGLPAAALLIDRGDVAAPPVGFASPGVGEPSLCAGGRSQSDFRADATSVGYASPRSAVRTRVAEGTELVELAKSTDHAEVIAVTSGEQGAVLFTVDRRPLGWSVTGEVSC